MYDNGDIDAICYSMYIPDIFKNFTKFFLLITHHILLSK
jgi:hypothetical protein